MHVPPCLCVRESGRMGERMGRKLGGRQKEKEGGWKRQNERWDQGVRIEAVELSSPHSRGPRPTALQLHSHLGHTQREGGPNPLNLPKQDLYGAKCFVNLKDKIVNEKQKFQTESWSTDLEPLKSQNVTKLRISVWKVFHFKCNFDSFLEFLQINN